MPMLKTVTVSGLPDNRVNVVFAGDGYRASEIESVYAGHVANAVNHLFAGGGLTEPFGRYRNFFNIYRADTTSEQSGADHVENGIFRNTALDAAYVGDASSGRVLYIDDSKTAAVIDAAVSGAEGVTPDLVFVTVNDSIYGGGASRYAVFAGANEHAGELAAHEAGHAFAGLADEYGGSDTSYRGGEPVHANMTTDPAGEKWSRWLGYDQPGIGTIGTYEGGLYHDRGVYRPSMNSKMRSLDQPFDAISREQIILGIYGKVDPIDAHTPNGETVVGRDSVFATVVDPAVIDIRWTVDGAIVAEGDASFDLSDNGFGLGTYRVAALAQDSTGWVRSDPEATRQTVAWTIDVPTGATAGSDTLHGTGLSDKILGLAGDDAISGRGGSDRLAGGSGNDVLRGGRGDDRLFGDDGSGAELAAAGSDGMGAPGLDAAMLEIANLSALGSRPVSGGWNAPDGPSAGNAADVPDGDDLLIGGLGADRLTGGAGADIFAYGSIAECGLGTGRDVITDFARAEGDKVDLSAIDAAAGMAGDQPFRFIGAKSFSASGDLRCADGILQGDVDGDRTADFELQFLGLDTARKTDLLL